MLLDWPWVFGVMKQRCVETGKRISNGSHVGPRTEEQQNMWAGKRQLREHSTGLKSRKTKMTIDRRDFIELCGTAVMGVSAIFLGARPSGAKSKPTTETKKILIAHRGASGYAPEHT